VFWLPPPLQPDAPAEADAPPLPAATLVMEQKLSPFSKFDIYPCWSASGEAVVQFEPLALVGAPVPVLVAAVVVDPPLALGQGSLGG
jgi:hypothetical protein